jgi:hypothetical protein
MMYSGVHLLPSTVHSIDTVDMKPSTSACRVPPPVASRGKRDVTAHSALHRTLGDDCPVNSRCRGARVSYKVIDYQPPALRRP